MTSIPCPRCKQGTPDGLLCPNCVHAYHRALAQLETLLPALGEVLAGQANVARAIAHRTGPDTLALLIEAEQRRIPAWLRSREGRIALVPHAPPGSLDAGELLAGVRVTIAGCVTRVGGARLRERDLLGRRLDARPAPPPVHAGPVCETWCAHESCRAVRARPLRTDTTRAVGPVCEPHVHDLADRGCDNGDCKQLHPAHVHRPARPGCPDDCGRPFHCRHESCRQVRAGHDAEPGMRALHWLHRHTDQVRRSEHAGTIVAALTAAARLVEEAVDSYEADVYVGLCDSPGQVTLKGGTVTVDAGGICGARLFVRPGETVATCPVCQWRYRVDERRRWLLNEARDEWMRPKQIAMAIAAVDLDLTAARLDTWISRDKKRHAHCWPGEPCGHIVAVGLDSDELDKKGRPLGRPLYRLGDVLDRVEALRRERAAKEAEVS